MKTNFYDIESLKNVFTLCNFKPEDRQCDVYFLVDTPKLLSDPDFEKNVKKIIREKNENLKEFNITDDEIHLYDLRFEVANRHMASTFGLSDAFLVSDKKSQSSFPEDFRLVCDVDPNYNEDEFPYFFGYNSYNYDTTIYALYMNEVYPLQFAPTPNQMSSSTLSKAPSEGRRVFTPTTAETIREYNNELFSKRFKDKMYKRLLTNYDFVKKAWEPDSYNNTPYLIRQNMIVSGRHLDVARLNEKQSKVGLKRLLGMLGFQILESDKLKQGQDEIETIEQLYELIAYNVSDCVNLKKLFDHPFYQGQFTLKRGLLKTYPELVYEKLPNEYKPDIRPEKVSKFRMTIDSPSAQLATKSLCPYGHLTDMPVVSFMYPSENKAKELGIPRVNVLEEAKKFFYKNFPQEDVRAVFDNVYNYYKSIEGKNFNESNNYLEDYGKNGSLPPELKVYSLAKMPKYPTCVPYFNADGTPSRCFALFSTGGIHGAEYNQELFDADYAAWQAQMDDMLYVRNLYPDPIDLKKAKTVTMEDGRELKASVFLKSGSTLKESHYKDIESKEPLLFKMNDDGSTSLNTTYVWTSADPTNHEDFTSYYPNMLRMMEAFYNPGLGYDRYAEIFDNKQKYGKLMKDKSLSQEERDLYSVLREGTKLILNSASGAGDVNYETNIRMNNTIISMRIIGQLFSWRIGQAQTIAGAKITSTNTDGLYSVLDPTINDPLLAKESADIGVEIEPEPTYLISKDSNNRLEMNPDTGEIESASGGTLGCRKGPNPTKALAHPALIDWALSEYLIVAALKTKPTLGLDKPFDNETGMNILMTAKNTMSPFKFLNMAQNVIASSPGSVNYIFGTSDKAPSTPIIMQHYNRIFIMKDGTPMTVHLRAANAKAITPAQIKKRAKDKERAQQHDPFALRILHSYGVSMNDISNDKEATIKKVTNIEDSWYIYVQNKDMNYLKPDEYDFIINNLDFDKYLSLLRDAFENNWMNKVPKKDEPEAPSNDDVNTPSNPVSVNNPQDVDNSVDNSTPDTETVVSEDRTSETADSQVISQDEFAYLGGDDDTPDETEDTITPEEAITMISDVIKSAETDALSKISNIIERAKVTK